MLLHTPFLCPQCFSDGGMWEHHFINLGPVEDSGWGIYTPGATMFAVCGNLRGLPSSFSTLMSQYFMVAHECSWNFIIKTTLFGFWHVLASFSNVIWISVNLFLFRSFSNSSLCSLTFHPQPFRVRSLRSKIFWETFGAIVCGWVMWYLRIWPLAWCLGRVHAFLPFLPLSSFFIYFHLFSILFMYISDYICISSIII